MGGNNNPHRRKVLRNIAASGGASLIGMTAAVGASPKEASVDIDQLLQSQHIKRLKREVPSLKLSAESARVVGGDRSVVVIPANHGTVLTRPPEETDAARFYFNNWVPGVDDDWVEGTQAQLRVTDDKTVLTRTATDEETEVFLNSIDTRALDRGNTTVAVQPETGKVSISHIDTENRRFDRVQAEPAKAQLATKQKGLAAAKSGLEITDRETTHFSGSSNGTGVQSSCDQDDIIFCIVEAVGCVPCGLTVSAPPVFVACAFLVCLGFPAVPVATILADIGCFNVGQCTGEAVVDIVTDIIDEFADQVPI
ncbi:hypothetical protein Halru_0898 [Halovivax ruber XH-70]|uniref:Uncharacterized protein n=1 Tax=Halovivax ruber (strain DSM 18193 / JCM 13892 / XH-70) TaxID=797302 RepID=L0I7H3_HALRX|nr:hypothetical protein [Halovivax ruber]AGB15520.1 hypothetical protein Halru_0898 [Halovivax ruber XH-70]